MADLVAELAELAVERRKSHRKPRRPSTTKPCARCLVLVPEVPLAVVQARKPVYCSPECFEARPR